MLGIGIGAVALALGILYGLGSMGLYNLPYALRIVDALLAGLVVTLGLVAVVIPVGFVAGFFIGWARTTRSWWARALGATYVEFFRGLPPIVLIFFAWLISSIVLSRYFRVEDPFPIAFAVGVIALGLHSSAYQAEIIRAGILSVPSSQVEASDAIGMTRWQSMFRVVLPQALRVSLPALGNEFASVIKDTSLISAISAMDLSLTGIVLVREALGIQFDLVYVIWAEIALLYFVLTFAVTRTVRLVENAFKVPGLEAAQL